MKHAILVPVDGPIEYIEIAESAEYETLSELVGGMIESVPMPAFVEPECSAYINEEGKINGLPYNGKATDFFVPGVGIFRGDYIAGPMVLIGYDPRTGESTDAIPYRVGRRIEKISKEAN